jgi:hypothetical protein
MPRVVHMNALRIIAIVVGALALLTGVVWVLQGIRVLNQGFMAGETRWTVIGSITAAAGLALIVAGGVRGRSGCRPPRSA